MANNNLRRSYAIQQKKEKLLGIFNLNIYLKNKISIIKKEKFNQSDIIENKR